MESEGVKKAERYSSGGVVMGVIGLVGVAAVLVPGLLDPDDGPAVWAYPCGVLVAIAIWAVMVRPAVVLGEHEVELRNIIMSRWIPYARITDVSIGQVTTIRTEDGKYVGGGFGRSRRAISRDQVATSSERSTAPSLGLLVEEKLKRRVKAAAGTTAEVGPVRRTWAWPVIAALLAAAVATAVAALVA